MTIYTNEKELWEAVAVGYMLKNYSSGTREETAEYAGKLADALVLEMRKRERS
ncbi:hypothetical protein [Pseudomonas sp. QTF5]|uniref:hypothetical protein n=1 Tax=Pseudomonas sp. QTF5 TaxID=1435425 RepID=UPI001303FEB3|nr:hypothetical protein [Pseudomonas sp. QTF5]